MDTGESGPPFPAAEFEAVELSRRREALLGRLRRRKTREREGLFLVEGIRGSREALRCEADVRFAVCSPRVEELTGGPALVRELEEAGVDVVRVSDDRLDALADTESPQGLLLVAGEGETSLEELMEKEECRLLILDGVQDPGNVGTLVRAGAGFGVSGVLALDGTADPWNPKAVRAAAGALFRLPVVGRPWREARALLREARMRLLVAEAGGTDVAIMDAGAPWGMVVGNEAHGPRAELVEAADATVAVPMAGGVDSLNVAMAGAILLYVLTRPGEPPSFGERREGDLVEPLFPEGGEDR